MGMAASQARFLGLTARKTNVEYEGQQINQQRTTLANQSANYYNQLLGMTVPTPPSVSDYTKTVYTFEDGNLSNSITTLVAQANGMYKVSYVSSWENDFTPVSNGVAIIFEDSSTSPKTYRLGNETLDKLGEATQSNRNGAYPSGLESAQFTNLATEETQYETMLNDKYGTPTGGWLVRYVQNTTTGVWEPNFYNADEVSAVGF